MIHRSTIGSLERVFGFLIEHYGGAFPLWLSPVQARVLPISEDHVAYANEVKDVLKQVGIRVEVDSANESLGKKIRNAKTDKVPYVLVVGDAEVSAKTLSVESRDHGKLEAMSVDALVERLSKEISDRA
jgi:threonyl-tRNA synthetase